LLDPLNKNDNGYLDLKKEAIFNKEVYDLIFLFIPHFVETVKIYILDNLEAKNN
jgi:hypothetical protein